MGRSFFLRKGEIHTVPVPGTFLYEVAEGSAVRIRENGSPVEYYVAKHDYESGLNGAGRTLLVRKNGYNRMAFGSNNKYASSAIRALLNGEFLGILDSAIKSAVAATTFCYTVGGGDNTVTTLSDAVFCLSMTELGYTAAQTNTEGSALPIAALLQRATHGGSAIPQWTRTPNISGTSAISLPNAAGAAANANVGSAAICSRPCFTLPGSLFFLPDGTIKV